MKKYTFAKLGPVDLGVCRLSGPGLANCMYMAARSYIEAQETGRKLITPTWNKISIGPILRGERDKRTYTTLFHSRGVKSIAKIVLMLLNKIGLVDISITDNINGYFSHFYGKSEAVREYFDSIVNKSTLQQLENVDFDNTVAIHVRLGDYGVERRLSFDWYKGIITNLKRLNPQLKFALFSDGTEGELKELTDIPGISRQFYGNAFADMTAISRCILVVASDSTFSAWGAFLGQKPIIFSRRHFPPVYGADDNIDEWVLGDSTVLPETLKIKIAPNNRQ